MEWRDVFIANERQRFFDCVSRLLPKAYDSLVTDRSIQLVSNSTNSQPGDDELERLSIHITKWKTDRHLTECDPESNWITDVALRTICFASFDEHLRSKRWFAVESGKSPFDRGASSFRDFVHLKLDMASLAPHPITLNNIRRHLASPDALISDYSPVNYSEDEAVSIIVGQLTSAVRATIAEQISNARGLPEVTSENQIPQEHLDFLARRVVANEETSSIARNAERSVSTIRPYLKDAAETLGIRLPSHRGGDRRSNTKERSG